MVRVGVYVSRFEITDPTVTRSRAAAIAASLTFGRRRAFDQTSLGRSTAEAAAIGEAVGVTSKLELFAPFVQPPPPAKPRTNARARAVAAVRR